MKKFLALALTAALLFPLAVIGTSATADAWDGSAATSFESGSGTEAFPYVIKTGAQLAYLAQQVANGANTYAGKHFALGGNINLSGKEWTPIGIGSSSPFKGSFDGKGYTVSGIKIDGSANMRFCGLFGCVITDGYFKNLVIADSNINAGTESALYAGAAAGYIEAAEISSIIVKSDVKVASTDSTGGVFGRLLGSAKYIVNYATVSGSGVSNNSFAGGICGTLGNNATLSHSVNYGNVIGDAFYNAGIVGIVGSNDGGGSIINCYNNGDVKYTGTKNAFVAGITARLGFKAGDYEVKNTYNLGEFSAPDVVKRIGEVTVQTYKGSITLENVYSIDLTDVEVIFKNDTSADMSAVGNKSETELKTLADAIDSEINANITVPSAEPEIIDPVVTAIGILTDSYFTDSSGSKLNYKAYLPKDFASNKNCKVIFNISPSTEIIDALIKSETDAVIFSFNGSTSNALELIDLVVRAYELSTNFMYLIGSSEVNDVRGDAFVGYLADASKHSSPLAAGEALLAVKANYYSVLEDITMYAMGDSYFAGHLLGKSVTWVNKLGEKYNMHYVNYGINGSMMSDYDPSRSPMVIRIKDMERGDADIILLEGGRNDLTNMCPLGTSGSRDTKTFNGAVNDMLDYLRATYPDALIILVTPWKRTNALDNGYSNMTYANILRSIAEERKDYHIVCLYAADPALTGIDMDDNACRAKYCIAPSDLSHLNEEGMDMVFPKMEKFIAEAYTVYLNYLYSSETTETPEITETPVTEEVTTETPETTDVPVTEAVTIGTPETTVTPATEEVTAETLETIAPPTTEKITYAAYETETATAPTTDNGCRGFASFASLSVIICSACLVLCKKQLNIDLQS